MAFVEAPTALLLPLPRSVTSANLPLQQLMGVLTFYNVIFVFPLVLLGIYLLFGDRAADLLDRINLDH